MYRYYLCLLLCISINIGVRAQGEANIWTFGESAGIDFNSGIAVPILTAANSIDSRYLIIEANASICDADGQLLFYTNGTQVWNKNHTLMSNGSDLPGFGYNITSSTSQGVLIVPSPENKQQYYVFSLTSMEVGEKRGQLSYSIIDMSLNNGLGTVTATKGILLDTGLTEQMTAVSGDDCNIWVITISRTENVFKIYNIDASGIAPKPVISPAIQGRGSFLYSEIAGNIDVSPNREKIAVARNSIVVYDFDVLSGTVSHPVIIDTTGYFDAYAAAFSPDNSRLYITNLSFTYLDQYDVSLLKTTTSHDSIMLKARISIPISRAAVGGALRRAPDGKIYIGSVGAQALHVIHYPNLADSTCQLEIRGFSLYPGTKSTFGLPNVPTLLNGKYIDSKRYDTLFCLNSWELTPRRLDGIEYVWDDSSRGMSRTVYESGTYWVQYNRNGTNPAVCGSGFIDTFYIVFNRQFPEQLLPEIKMQSACREETNGRAYAIAPFADSLTYAYVWLNNAGDTLAVGDTLQNVPAGQYFLYIKLLTGCNTILPVTITQEDYRVNFAVTDTICVGALTTFQNLSPGHFEYFRWEMGDGSFYTKRDVQHKYTFPDIYEVVLSGMGKICSDTTRKKIVVDAIAADLRFSADKHEICLGAEILFTFQPDSTIRNSQWNFGDYTGYGGGSYAVTHAYGLSGVMPVTLNASFRACPDITYADTIIVHHFPVVDLGKDSVICLTDVPITLLNLYPQEEGDIFQWNTGHLTPSITVAHPDLYSLTVSNRYGCTTTGTVDIKKDCYTDIPNAFSPNGDGVNDYFYPHRHLTSAGLTYHMNLFNRWGQLIFKTTERDGRGWDGKFNGIDQPGDVYIYRIVITLDNGRQERHEGNVTLVR